jgi:hypothetical protein
MTSLGAWHTLTSPNTHVHVISLIIAIYHYYEISSEINTLSFSLLHSHIFLHILVIIDIKTINSFSELYYS